MLDDYVAVFDLLDCIEDVDLPFRQLTADYPLQATWYLVAAHRWIGCTDGSMISITPKGLRALHWHRKLRRFRLDNVD